MRKTLLTVLALCLALALPAQAAPTRDMTVSALEHQDLLEQIQPLVDAAAAAAMRLDYTFFREGTTPEPAFVEGLLYQALGSHLIVREANEGVIALTRDEAREAARGLLVETGVPGFDSTGYPGVSMENGTLHFDLTRQEDYIGGHIYDLSVDEVEVLVSADIYRLNGIVANAQDAPEDSLTWLGHIGLRLKPQPETPLGFVLASFSIPERYRESASIHHVEKNRFELQYPDFLAVPLPEDEAYLSISSEDGLAKLIVRDVPGTLDSLLDEWIRQSPGGQDAHTGWIENGRLVMHAPGVFRLAYPDAREGTDNCLVLEMVFPSENLHEFTLIQTFLDNSFVVYSHSVG